MNRCIFSGNVGKDPEIRETQSGMKVARFSLAVKRGFKKEDQDTDWINLVAFDKRADFAESYIHRGTKLMVETHVKIDSYTDRDGNKRTSTDFIVDSAEFMESKKASEANEPEPTREEPKQETRDDDFPFA